MNFKKLGKILGKIMILEGILMIAPFIVSLVYRESTLHVFAFVIPIVALVLIGLLLQLPKPKRNAFYQKDSFQTPLFDINNNKQFPHLVLQ